VKGQKVQSLKGRRRRQKERRSCYKNSTRGNS
jgi:hypothetical protein